MRTATRMGGFPPAQSCEEPNTLGPKPGVMASLVQHIAQRRELNEAHTLHLMDELKEILALFEDSDEQIAEKRLEVLRTVRENDVSSFPTDISVLSAFDDVLLCFALGGQVRNYYRYGTYTTCLAQREKFWFAMWNGSISESEINVESVAQNPRELERRKRVQQFYKDRLFDKKMGGSSEDVWDARTKLLSAPFKE